MSETTNQAIAAALTDALMTAKRIWDAAPGSVHEQNDIRLLRSIIADRIMPYYLKPAYTASLNMARGLCEHGYEPNEHCPDCDTTISHELIEGAAEPEKTE